MLQSVRIKHFQSLYDVRLDFEPFTVIVGPSSSGKSAFVRALKFVTSNARGTSYITQGTTTAEVEVTLANGNIVKLERSTKSSAPNRYTVNGEVFSKLAGGVPEAVSEALELPPDSTLHVASQFDAPYLLGDSPAENARTLGTLTNVHKVLEAARESNRKKLSSSSTLKVRKGDVDRLQQELTAFDDLPGREARLEEAQKLVDALRADEEAQKALSDALSRLLTLSNTVKEAESVLERKIPSTGDLEALIEEHSALVQALDSLKTLSKQIAKLPPKPPISWNEIQPLEVEIRELDTLQSRYSKLQEHSRILKKSKQDISQLKQQKLDAEREYEETLNTLGVCPLCGQTINHKEH